ncbi:EAL domain-containing protein (plasmid) [Deinococcus psychrotolerans]|uniref:EAL domain-containing protein n=1 Tax=Deinococcus psychrotolerans TaxID=2489213 RepID=A0A3G8YJD3_9DEIO|nr:EAL domain-containing protein [Deinococcus psychrotolerans]AZI45015.1 EAL domain-containing protein [Deinococcus psychrotolerans]
MVNSVSALGASAAVSDTERLQELMTAAEPLLGSDAERAELLLREAHTLSLSLGDGQNEARVLTLLGLTYFYRSQFQTAIDVLERARTLATSMPDAGILARILNGLGICAQSLGNYGTAMEHFWESQQLAAASGDDLGSARTLCNVGIIRTELGEYDLAVEAFLEVSSFGEATGNVLLHLTSVVNLAFAYQQMKQDARAIELAHTHLPTVRRLGLRQLEVVLQGTVARSLVKLGQLQETLERVQDVMSLAEEVGNQEVIVNLRLAQGLAFQRLGRSEEAQYVLQMALYKARQYGIKPDERTILNHLSELHAERHEWQQAYESSRAYQVLEQTLHAEEVDRKARMLGAQMQLERLQQEAEVERLRNAELSQANTALQTAKADLAHRATHDALTGLANRAYFQSEVERALSEGSLFGILFIDLDRFKLVNDTLGHDVGDELLKQVARQLTQVVRSGDLVARMGGDEFTIILRRLRSAQDAERVANKVLNQLAQPIHVRGHTLHVTGSIGVAVAPHDGQDVTTLQRHADIAMYRAKNEGKNGVRIFRPTMGEETTQRVGLERDLRLALAQDELVLHYQGQFDARSQMLVGFEALVRWQHPTQGLLSPGKFIQVAEENELIVPLGEWVLREACRQAALWEANSRDFTMSVNVSALQFEHSGLLNAVQQALASSGLDPQRLVLELTESVVLRNPEVAALQLTRLKDLGIRVALDDFGTGQSSLSLLRTLPIDVLKIDRSFVQDENIAEGSSARMLLNVMITLAHGLNMLVTGEGVETPEQQALLDELGCDNIQGFLLGQPGPPEDICWTPLNHTNRHEH